LTLSNPFACARASAGAASAVSMLQQQAPDTTALTRLGVDSTVSGQQQLGRATRSLLQR